ncbi:MAG: acetate kinase [Sedimentisphaerales bacterium]|nr:acetate kinase [Sedimentisphaerales bacterium]
MKILVLNAGSSSIKYQLFEMPDATVLAKGIVERIGRPDACLKHEYNGNTHQQTQAVEDHEEAMAMILGTLVDARIGVLSNIRDIFAVGHRVVHGAEEFTGSVRIDERVIASLEKYADLAPLHNPPNLVGIRAAMHKLPDAKQVACFDTAFHTTIPQVAYMYALPYEIYETYRIRRYGFHGTSHRYVTSRAAQIMGKRPEQVNLITCHLGNGCSITAVKGGKSVDTSMGFTPLEGLVMGTRTGDLDPAILFYLADKGYSVDQLNDLCNKKGGLLGLSGQSNDMRNLTELAQAGDVRAQLAIDIFCYRIRKYIGAYTAVLDTLDALIFTGGIGENAPLVRQAVCRDLTQIGIVLDPAKNEAKPCKNLPLNTDNSRVKVYVIPTNEEVAIAQDTYQLLE